MTTRRARTDNKPSNFCSVPAALVSLYNSCLSSRGRFFGLTISKPHFGATDCVELGHIIVMVGLLILCMRKIVYTGCRLLVGSRICARCRFPGSESVNNAGSKKRAKICSLDGLKNFSTRVKMSSGVHFGEKSRPRVENEARPVFHNSRLMVGCQRTNQLLMQHPHI